ncbi:MAG: ArnT family glycosyltransferase [Bacteriovoracia bacterium]
MERKTNDGKFRSGISFFSSTSSVFGWKMLALFLLVAYVPFLGDRMVRPAGDDKVYVSQVMEMIAHGDWFVQTLGEIPNYYKGPGHYLLLRAGVAFFGFSMWATTYMNLLLVILGAAAIGSLVQNRMREFEGWAFWAGAAFALNAGIFAHMFASQMEVEMASFFAIGLYLLDRAGPGKGDLRFWLVAGLLGWLKSPLHSVLLGSTAIIFWAWNGELFPRLKSASAWTAALSGIAVCALGYAPAFLIDRENFIMTYVYRETLWKPPNGSSWYYPVIPIFSYYLLPWMLPAFVAFADAVTRRWRPQRAVQSTPGSRRLVALGVSLVIPSVAFFIYHPYRGQNYDLPIIGGIIVWLAAIWATRAPNWTKFYSAALGLTAFLLLVIPLAFTYVVQRFNPMPFWWPSWQLPVLWIGAILTARGFWREGVTFQAARPSALARRYIWFLLAFSTFLSTLGNREMIDIRDRIYAATKNGERLNLSYYNLQRNIWSEWGYLNFMIPYPTRGLFTIEDLKRAVNANDLILVPGEEWLQQMHLDLDPIYPNAIWEIEPWKRWKTKGKNAAGQPAWKEAWDTQNLSRLERDFYMVRVKPNLQILPGAAHKRSR